jgi:glycosyltransferase involved in cell wall biosynthesis/GT2 family glycosyltransferase
VTAPRATRAKASKASKASKPSISVVVPTVGRVEAIARLLAALGRQTLSADAFETIVVVNGSGLESSLPDPGPRSNVQILRRQAAGRAGACNAGVAAARGRIVLFLDDDMEPVSGCLDAHLRAQDGGARRLVLGPVPVIDAEQSGPAAWYVATRFERHLAKLGAVGYQPEPSDVYTGNASIERDVLLEVGGFDDRLVEYGNEDRELARRLVRAGVAITIASDAIAQQHYDKSLEELLADSRSKGRTAAAIVAEDPSAINDTRMRRRGSWRRRVLRVGLTLFARLPTGRRVELAVVDRLVRARPASALALVGPLVDSEFWWGVAVGRAGAAESRVELRVLPEKDLGERPIRVVHVIDSTDFGGAEQVLLQLARGLDRGAWRSIVIHDQRAERLGQRLAELGIEAVATDLAGARPWLRVPAITRTVRRLRPDIVHVHRPWPRSGRVALAAATLARPEAIIVTDHLASGRASLRRRIVERLVTARVATWIAVSPDVSRGLVQTLGAPGDRVRTVLNGVAVDRQASGRESSDDIRPAEAARTGRLLVMLAQLRPQKRHEILLEALTTLPEDVTAVLAGDGPERPRIEARVAELGLGSRVHLAGFVEDVRALLDGADIVVLPSRFEGLPLALLEAMAVGRPIVATDVPGTRELVTDGQTGLLVRPDDPDQLANAIRRLLDDPDLARRLGEAGREQVTERFGLDQMVASVGTVYREAMTNGRSRTLDHAAVDAPEGSDPDGALTIERRLDVALRPIDLRILSGMPAPGRAAALGHDADELASALAIVAGSVVSRAELSADSPEKPVSGSCHLVVIGDAGPGDHELAGRLLAPGGSALLLPARGARRSISRRHLAAAGLEPIGEFWPWPDRRRPLAWIPIERSTTVHYVVEVWLGRNPVRRVVRRARAAFWLTRGRVGLVPSAVLAKRRGDGGRAMPAVPIESIPGGPELAWVLLTGGRRSHNRIVALGFPSDAASPSLVATCARVAESVPGLRREAAALRAVQALRPGGVRGVPTLLLEHGEGLATTILQTAIGGTRLSRLETADRFGELAERIGDWLVQLVRGNDDVGPEAVWSDIVGPLVDEFDGHYGLAEPMLAGRLRTSLADLARLPRAIEHRDLAPWNLRLMPSGELGVLDWESAELDGIAGPDLHYGLAHLAFDAAGAGRVDDQVATYRALLDSRSALGSAAAGVISRYAGRVGVAEGTVRRLALVAWLIHARSEYRRLAGDAGRSPDPEVLRQALFVGLMRADLDLLTPGAWYANESRPQMPR